MHISEVPPLSHIKSPFSLCTEDARYAHTQEPFPHSHREPNLLACRVHSSS